MREPASLQLDLPLDPGSALAQFRLPDAVQRRLQALLDKQDSGEPLNGEEQEEAEGLVDLAELLTLLRLRSA